MNQPVWSGHVTILRDDKGQNSILYRPDAEAAEGTYVPHGYFETHAVQGLVNKLTESGKQS